MSEKDLKTRLSDAWVAMKQVFKPANSTASAPSTNQEKQITQEIVNAELSMFMKEKGYTVDDISSDTRKIQQEFAEFLINKGYTFSSVELGIKDWKSKLKNIRKVSEQYNDYASSVNVFVDTTKMMPGLVCYVITKVEPTKKKPWVTYKPIPRIITQVHDSGVNGGTIFFTYDHKFIESPLNGFRSVISEDQVIYSPLTKEHADYICTLLNAQSRILYRHKMKKLMIAQQQNIK